MQKAPTHKRDPLPKGKWREYADESKVEEINHQPFRDFMSRCNRRAKEISFKAQVAAPAWDEEYWDEEDENALPAETFWWRRIFALFILLPVSAICLMALYKQLIYAENKLDILFSVPIWYSLLGGLTWVVLAKSKLFTTAFAYLYVVGHEMTHALAIYCSFGKVHGFDADIDGGYVKTTKNNIFIALSPYFIPLWALIWGGIYAVINYFHPIPQFEPLLYGGIGFWMIFHLFWTVWLIPRDQSDLRENDTFFSLMVICLANLLVLVFTLYMCDIIELGQFGRDCLANARQLWATIRDFIEIFR